MFCKNCGQQLSEGVQVCPYCMTELVKPEPVNSVENYVFAPVPEPKKPSSGKGKTIAIIAIALFLVLCVAAGAYIFLNNDKAKFSRYIKNNDIESAETLYDEVDKDTQKEFKELVLDKCDELIEDYKEDEEDFDTTNKSVEEWEAIIGTTKKSEDVKKIKESKNAFADAETHMENDEWLDALDDYEKVEKIATKEYDKSKDKKEECIENIKEEFPEQLDEMLEDEEYAEGLALITRAEAYVGEEVFKDYKEEFEEKQDDKYYPGTNIPTYTSITGIESRDYHETDSLIVYEYAYTDADTVGNYWRALSSAGWKTTDEDDPETTTVFESGFYNSSDSKNPIVIVNVYLDSDKVWVCFEKDETV